MRTDRELRINLFQSYKIKTDYNFDFSKNQNLCEILNQINTESNLYYAVDYKNKMFSSNSWITIQGMTNQHFWDEETMSCFFKMKFKYNIIKYYN